VVVYKVDQLTSSLNDFASPDAVEIAVRPAALPEVLRPDRDLRRLVSTERVGAIDLLTPAFDPRGGVHFSSDVVGVGRRCPADSGTTRKPIGDFYRCSVAKAAPSRPLSHAW
jgi:hypothetical protein